MRRYLALTPGHARALHVQSTCMVRKPIRSRPSSGPCPATRRRVAKAVEPPADISSWSAVNQPAPRRRRRESHRNTEQACDGRLQSPQGRTHDRGPPSLSAGGARPTRSSEPRLADPDPAVARRQRTPPPCARPFPCRCSGLRSGRRAALGPPPRGADGPHGPGAAQTDGPHVLARDCDGSPAWPRGPVGRIDRSGRGGAQALRAHRRTAGRPRRRGHGFHRLRCRAGWDPVAPHHDGQDRRRRPRPRPLQVWRLLAAQWRHVLLLHTAQPQHVRRSCAPLCP